MLNNCTCPDDWRSIPKERRVEVVMPGALQFVGGKKLVDRSKLHVFDRDCEVHGYREIKNE